MTASSIFLDNETVEYLKVYYWISRYADTRKVRNMNITEIKEQLRFQSMFITCAYNIHRTITEMVRLYAGAPLQGKESGFYWFLVSFMARYEQRDELPWWSDRELDKCYDDDAQVPECQGRVSLRDIARYTHDETTCLFCLNKNMAPVRAAFRNVMYTWLKKGSADGPILSIRKERRVYPILKEDLCYTGTSSTYDNVILERVLSIFRAFVQTEAFTESMTNMDTFDQRFDYRCFWMSELVPTLNSKHLVLQDAFLPTSFAHYITAKNINRLREIIVATEFTHNFTSYSDSEPVADLIRRMDARHDLFIALSKTIFPSRFTVTKGVPNFYRMIKNIHELFNVKKMLELRAVGREPLVANWLQTRWRTVVYNPDYCMVEALAEKCPSEVCALDDRFLVNKLSCTPSRYRQALEEYTLVRYVAWLHDGCMDNEYLFYSNDHDVCSSTFHNMVHNNMVRDGAFVLLCDVASKYFTADKKIISVPQFCCAVNRF